MARALVGIVAVAFATALALCGSAKVAWAAEQSPVAGVAKVDASSTLTELLVAVAHLPEALAAAKGLGERTASAERITRKLPRASAVERKRLVPALIRELRRVDGAGGTLEMALVGTNRATAKLRQITASLKKKPLTAQQKELSRQISAKIAKKRGSKTAMDAQTRRAATMANAAAQGARQTTPTAVVVFRRMQLVRTAAGVIGLLPGGYSALPIDDD